jgi:hypothetical protein
MFHATRDRTARFACVYSSARRFASHRADTGLGIPRISRTTRHSMGDSVSPIASALNHDLGTPGTGAGPILPGGSFGECTNPYVVGAGPLLACVPSVLVMLTSLSAPSLNIQTRRSTSASKVIWLLGDGLME